MRTLPPLEEVRRLEALIVSAPVFKTGRTDVQRIDSRYVTRAWEKTIERLKDDPEGAVTSARSLVETVCLHILDSLEMPTESRGDLLV